MIINFLRRKAVKNQTLALVLCLFTSAVFASALQQISVDQGLAGGEIWGIQTDDDGYTWLLSSSGLYRYDGYQIKGFPTEHPLSNASGVAMEKHPDGSIWVATSESGVWKLLPKEQSAELVIPYQKSEEFNYFTPNTMIWLNDHQLLLGLFEHALIYDTKSNELDLVFKLPTKNIDGHMFRGFMLHEGFVLMGTSAGMFAMDVVTKQSFRIHHTENEALYDEDNVKAFVRFNEKLLVSSVNGLYQYPLDFLKQHNTFMPYKKTAELVIKDINVWDFLKHNDDLFMATNKGLMQLDYDKKTSIEITKFSDAPFYVSNENMIKLHEGKDGLFWLGSISDGVFIWDSKSKGFSNISINEGLLSNNVWSLSTNLKDDLLWVGTDEGLNYIDLETGAVETAINNQARNFADNTVEDTILHPNSLVYIFTAKGVWEYDPESKTAKAIQYKNGSAEENAHYAWGAELAPDGRLWWFSEYGAYRYDPKTNELVLMEVLNDNSRLAWDCVFFNGPPPKMFISCPNLLHLINTETLEVEKITEYQGLVGFDQTSVYLTDSMAIDDNMLWWFTVGTHGLIVIDPVDYSIKKHFLPGKELPITNYSSISKDLSQGVFWVGTGQGLVRINPTEFQIMQFSIHDGTFTNDFSYGESLYLKNGQLVFGSTKGLVFFNSDDFIPNKPKQQKVYLSGTHSHSLGRQGSKRLSALQSVFEPDDTGLHFSFTTLNYHKTKNTKFLFTLNGPQEISFPPQNSNNITFPQLKPGNYVLKTTALNTLTGLRSEQVQTKFSIKHHWWLSPIAKILYLSAIGFLALFWYNSRRKQQKALRIAHAKSLKSEKRLFLALQGSNSQVWEWQASSNQINQRRIIDLLGFINEPQKATVDHHLSFIHPDDQTGFKRTWERFITLRESPFKYTYRMKSTDGKWLWFSDIASGQFDQGQLTQATGTYANITEQHAQEYNATLFGEVFLQANDAVLILNQKWRVKTVNNAFIKTFNLLKDEIVGLGVNELYNKLGLIVDLENTQKQVSSIGHHREEALVEVSNSQFPVLISYSMVKGLGQGSQCLVTFINIKALKEAENALQQMAKFDHLTGLSNRRSFMSVIHELCNSTKNHVNKKALLFIDLDRFKQVNDSLGHNRGDQLLQEVSRRIKETSSKDDLIGRYGGDEFVMLLDANEKTEQQIKQTADKLIETISQPINLGIANVSVSPSIGIAMFPKDASTAFDFLQAADFAMYNAKAKGRSNYQFFTEEMKQGAQKKLEREHQIKHAHENNKFINYYQPLINKAQNKISGFELLLRWDNNGSTLLPRHFIAEAEDIGLLGAMTLKAFKSGLEDLKKWHQIDPSLSININVSARHFEENSFVKDFQEVLKGVDADADKVNIELTESILLKNKQAALNTVQNLRELGFRLYLDDFGTGYSSLSYIHALSLDGVKIDKSFVSRLDNDDKALAITEGITQLCVGLGFVVVAEGIETQQQSEQMFNMGAQVQQGFWYAKPLSAEQVELYLTSKENIIPHQ